MAKLDDLKLLSDAVQQEMKNLNGVVNLAPSTTCPCYFEVRFPVIVCQNMGF